MKTTTSIPIALHVKLHQQSKPIGQLYNDAIAHLYNKYLTDKQEEKPNV